MTKKINPNIQVVSARLQNLIFILYGLIAAILTLYSYTQVDLNLTLSHFSIWQSIQKLFQYVGFYERPISAWIYISIIAIFFILYLILIILSKKYYFSPNFIWKIILMTGIILVFSYPAFSYDIYNYVFSAKTIVVYGLNPYTFKPIELSGIDPWLNFMRWIHLTSAYTPLWIGFTVPIYIIGNNIFLITLFLFKFCLFGFYLLTSRFIQKVLETIKGNHVATGMIIFSLNPLVLIESIVSPHNDIMLSAFMLLSLYLYLNQKKYLSLLSLAVSIAAKLVTIGLLPIFLVRWNRKISLYIMFILMIAAFWKKEILPWYGLWVIPLAAVNQLDNYLLIFITTISLGLLLRYFPFLYFGDYSSVSNQLRDQLFYSSVGLGVFLAIITKIISFRLRFALKRQGSV